METALRDVDQGPRRGRDGLTLNVEREFPLQDIEALVLAEMPVQRWPSIPCLRGVLKGGVGLAPQLKGDQLGAHQQEPLTFVRSSVGRALVLRFHVALLRHCLMVLAWD